MIKGTRQEPTWHVQETPNGSVRLESSREGLAAGDGYGK